MEIRLYKWYIRPSKKALLLQKERGGKYYGYISEIKDKGAHLIAKVGNVTYILIK